MDGDQPGIRERLGVAIGDCARIWRLRANERLKPLGLSQSTWLALWHLSTSPDGLRQNELADRLGIEGPTLVRLLDRLEKDGLVRRETLASDRRQRQITLTAQADPLLATVRSRITELRAEVLADLPEAQMEAAHALLTTLIGRLDRLR